MIKRIDDTRGNRKIGPVRAQKQGNGNLVDIFKNAAGDIWRGIRHDFKKRPFITGGKLLYGGPVTAGMLKTFFDRNVYGIITSPNYDHVYKAPEYAIATMTAILTTLSATIAFNFWRTGRSIRKNGVFTQQTGTYKPVDIIMPNGEIIPTKTHDPIGDEIYKAFGPRRY